MLRGQLKAEFGVTIEKTPKQIMHTKVVKSQVRGTIVRVFKKLRQPQEITNTALNSIASPSSRKN
jgi:hypothetical protein